MQMLDSRSSTAQGGSVAVPSDDANSQAAPDDFDDLEDSDLPF